MSQNLRNDRFGFGAASDNYPMRTQRAITVRVPCIICEKPFSKKKPNQFTCGHTSCYLSWARMSSVQKRQLLALQLLDQARKKRKESSSLRKIYGTASVPLNIKRREAVNKLGRRISGSDCAPSNLDLIVSHIQGGRTYAAY